MTVADIFEFKTRGALDFSNKERVVPRGETILPKKKNPQDEFGWWNLTKGTYRVRTNEIVNMPNDLTALAFSRTSLMRMGAYTVHGVWDAGFCGRSEFILTVQNTEGICLKQNARVAQLVFFVTDETESYNGIYQEK